MSKISASELTAGQQKALVAAVFGIEKMGQAGGFFCQGDPEYPVDGRSLSALRSRGLIDWHVSGGASMMIHIEATGEGHRIYEEELRWL